MRSGEDPVPPSGQNQTLCFDVRPGESGSGVGSLGPVPPARRTRPEYASIFRAECEKWGVWFCPLGGTGPKDPTPDPDSPGLTSKHRVWFCPLGGTGSSPGLTRTKLLQDTIKQYPALCASFFLNTIPYYPSKLSQPLLSKTLIEENSASRYIYIYTLVT